MGNKMQSRKNTYTLAALFLVLVLDTMGFGLIFPVLSPIFMGSTGGILPASASLMLRDTLYAVTLVIFSLSMFLGAPILGDLSDFIGRKKVLLLCLFGTAISSLFCALGIQYKSVIVLFIGRVMAGFMGGSQPVAQAAIADISAPENKAKNLSLVVFAASIGFVIGPIVGGYFSNPKIVPWFSYSIPFIADAILALINGLLLMVTFKETFVPKLRALNISIQKGIDLFLQALRHRAVCFLVFILLLAETAWSLYFQYIGLYLVQSYHYTSAQIGLFMSFLGCIFGLTTLFVIRILLRFFAEVRLLQLALLMSAVGLLLLVGLHSILIQWYAAVPINMGMGLTYAVLLTLMSNEVSKDKQGWVMGVAAAAVSMAWIISAILIEVAYIAPNLPFGVACVLMFVAVGMFMFFRV